MEFINLPASTPAHFEESLNKTDMPCMVRVKWCKEDAFLTL